MLGRFAARKFGGSVKMRPQRCLPLHSQTGSYEPLGLFRTPDVFREGAENRTRGGCAPRSVSEFALMLRDLERAGSETGAPLPPRVREFKARHCLAGDIFIPRRRVRAWKLLCAKEFSCMRFFFCLTGLLISEYLPPPLPS